MVAGVPALVRTVLSVTLKTRAFSLPAMVKVFAVWSTAEMMPWKGMARSVLVFAVGGAVLLDEAVLGGGEGDFSVAA